MYQYPESEQNNGLMQLVILLVPQMAAIMNFRQTLLTYGTLTFIITAIIF